MKNKLIQRTLLYLTLFAVFLFVACGGGGTQGTGLGTFRIITGTVTVENEEPLEGASVTIVETGDSDITDNNGEFEIETELESENFRLQVQKDKIDTTIEVSGVDSETNNLALHISLETQENIGSISTLEVWARMVGECDAFFENHPRIRQSVAVPSGGLDCTLKFFASGDGKRLERVPAEIEVRSCNGNSENWKRIAIGTTGVGRDAGVGQINFHFIDNKENCLYRLRAPVEISGVKPVTIFIDSFTFQRM